jgi:hypothetical protein
VSCSIACCYKQQRPSQSSSNPRNGWLWLMVATNWACSLQKNQWQLSQFAAVNLPLPTKARCRAPHVVCCLAGSSGLWHC